MTSPTQPPPPIRRKPGAPLYDPACTCPRLAEPDRLRDAQMFDPGCPVHFEAVDSSPPIWEQAPLSPPQPGVHRQPLFPPETDPSRPLPINQPRIGGGDGGGKKRSWFARHKVLTALFSVVGAFVVLGGIGAAVGGSSDGGSKVVAAATSAADSTKGTALDPNYSPPPAAPPAPTSTGVDDATTPPPKPAPPAQPQLTTGQEQAIGKAKDYLDYMNFSKSGLVEQLVFDDFSKADATFAVNHITVNWNEQAAGKAKSYLDYTHFSRSGLIQQLEFDGFTRAQATYGVDKVGL